MNYVEWVKLLLTYDVVFSGEDPKDVFVHRSLIDAKSDIVDGFYDRERMRVDRRA